jgi:hypothetical protein
VGGVVRYRSRPIEVEAMRWCGCSFLGCVERTGEILAWVNTNGGEARYEPASWWAEPHRHHARIAVRTINGWAYARPGHYVVKGSTWFDPYSTSGRGKAGKVRDFYPCDPETFEKRWEAAL